MFLHAENEAEHPIAFPIFSHNPLMRLKHTAQRFARYEFWPFWVFYSPFLLVWMWYAIRSRSFIYFARTNPGMRFGGLMQYSKYDILKKLNPQYVPTSEYYTSWPENPEFFQEKFNYPFIFKPDMGERGRNIELIRNEEDWKRVYGQSSEAFILQEYISYPHEFGVLYYRFPSGEDGITSVVAKGFLTLKGDGQLTLKDLICQDLRARPRNAYFFDRYADQLDRVLANGEEFVLEHIGNHSRGTTFFNANHLIGEELLQVFREISAPVDGFYYGRYDLKVPSEEDLKQGRNIKIFELNGVNSEAAHIYDPAGKLGNAYRDVFQNLELVFKISKENAKRGVKTGPFSEFIGALIKQIFRRS